MRLRGKLAELLVLTAPQTCKKHVTINQKGEKVLHVRLLNVLHGLLQGSLLFYKKFVKNLFKIGLELKPCNPCLSSGIARATLLLLSARLRFAQWTHVVVVNMNVKMGESLLVLEKT